MSFRLTTLSENTASRFGFLGEHGLSMLLELDGYQVLLDTGLSFSATCNAIALGLDLSAIEKIVFSHGHADHTGGLLYLLQIMRKEVEIIAHPDIWASKCAFIDGKEVYGGVPYPRGAAEALGARFELCKEPVWISDSIVTSGEIPMVSGYEQIDANNYVKEQGQLRPDPLADDQALFVRSHKGLAVFSGCAHRGIVNTVKHGQEVTGVETVYAVIGGTHLMVASPERLDWTIAELKRLGVQRLGASHCTGLRAASLLAHAFGDNFFFNNAGVSLDLEA